VLAIGVEKSGLEEESIVYIGVWVVVLIKFVLLQEVLGEALMVAKWTAPFIR
jgi:hypothetical protein